MKPIANLSNLLELLLEEGDDDYEQIVQQIKIPFSELESLTQWDSNFYTRTCLVRNKKYELLLLCWEPGQFTPIHCHDSQECWMHIVHGSITEHRYELDEDGVPIKTNTTLLKEGTSYHINDDLGFHNIDNDSNERSVSLHLYASPIEECSYYSEDSGSFKRKKMSDYKA